MKNYLYLQVNLRSFWNMDPQNLMEAIRCCISVLAFCSVLTCITQWLELWSMKLGGSGFDSDRVMCRNEPSFHGVGLCLLKMFTPIWSWMSLFGAPSYIAYVHNYLNMEATYSVRTPTFRTQPTFRHKYDGVEPFTILRVSHINNIFTMFFFYSRFPLVVYLHSRKILKQFSFEIFF